MNVTPKKYRRGFDEKSRQVYPYLMSYPSEEDVLEAIPALAKKLGISRQAVGAYIGQAKRNAGVYRLPVRMGYADYQVPLWFKRPKHPVDTPVRPQATPIETKPPEYILAEPARRYPPKSDLELLMERQPRSEIMWLSPFGNKIERNPDLSRYKIETVHLYEFEANTSSVQANPEPHQPTEEELRSQKEDELHKYYKERFNYRQRAYRKIYDEANKYLGF